MTAAAGVPPQKSRPAWFRVKPWVATPAEAPWYYPGAKGETERARASLEMRRNCGYQQRDSAPATSGTAERPVASEPCASS